MDDQRRQSVRDDRRNDPGADRRARTRGGRRAGESAKPWYMKQRLWVAVASVVFVGWRRIAGRGRAA
jgi:hypothetical protein